MPDLAEAPFLDIFDPDLDADPEPIYAALREETAVARTPLGAAVLRRDAIHRLLGDRRLISSIPHLVRLQGAGDGPVGGLLESSVIAVDGDDHTRLRRLVSRSFTPSAANRHRPLMRSLVQALVNGFAVDAGGRGRCEFVSELADHYPVRVICSVLGVPDEDHEQFGTWAESITYMLSLELSAHLDEVVHAVQALGDYVTDLVEERRRNPRDDLLTSLVQASEDGDRLSNDELLSMVGGLLFAGVDTTRNQLGLAMHTFCEHPDQWELLRTRPELTPAAVNETMRLFGAVPGIPRVTLEDVEVEGWCIPAGTIVFLSLASANRDPRHFDDPMRFDITAEREPHLTFGGGPHYCLGANLAKAEMEEALLVLATSMPDLRLHGEPAWRTSTGIGGPTHLPLSFAAG
ncbi:cytochrome P450 [Acidimicrobiia bacterium EGI L10123]|uniref:cytochrome P450 n=1 Tax=Salinilacustrithrix flava TaxID=2957203 RepID=UPI003D7C1BBF|nr:cytochrome P450 [Acidimicrobiia bacterium EGI L10123]